MKGQLIIVTGGNRGLGYDVCRKLVKSGHRVLLCSRNAQAGKDAVQSIRSEVGSSANCTPIQLDVSDTSSVQDFVSSVAKDYDREIYALINNAGVYLDGWTQENFAKTLRTNFLSPMDLAFGLAPHMVQGGRIVNVTSSLGSRSNLNKLYQQKVTEATNLEELKSMPFDPGFGGFKPAYCLTKSMINRAGQLISQLPGFQHLSVNAADPGWCRTEMGGGGAPRSIGQGSDSILAVLNFPPDIKGGVFNDGKASRW